MQHYLSLFALSAVVVLSACSKPPVPIEPPVLIERSKLFGNPDKAGGMISPDGKWISWLAPSDGVLNIWVAPASDLTQARVITHEKERPLINTHWAPDSSKVLYLQDNKGDENFLLYGVDIATDKQLAYTPFPDTTVDFLADSEQIKDRILVQINNRDPRWHDIYSLDIHSGKLTLVLQNDGYVGFLADKQLNPRIAIRPTPNGGSQYFWINKGQIDAKPFTEISLEDSTTTSPVSFTVDGKTLYWTDARGRDKAALIAQNVATGTTKVLAEDAHADISDIVTDPKSGLAIAYEVNYLRPKYHPLSDTIKDDLDFLEQNLPGEFLVRSSNDDDTLWLLVVIPASSPVSTWLYDRKKKHLQELFISQTALIGAPLEPMHPQVIKARDGLELVSYLTLPKISGGAGTDKPSRTVPMVLLVHGGPAARDYYGYNPMHQWLANRGYAVLSVNFRGSTGFGKQFQTAGDKEWGAKMNDDLLDAVEWAINKGITTRDQVAIMGGSYGGYATLAALTFTPTTFACGVDIVGPSNLLTLLDSIPPYWEGARRQIYERVGNPETEDGRALLQARSPLNFAGEIQRPLLIGQGANDPRVKIRESDQIVEAMAAKNIPVTYVVFPDEGHGFHRPENDIAFNAIAENFLASCLKSGRAEPMADAVKESTAEIRHGGEFVPGLTAETK